jgi:hypothetical protein
MARTKETLMAPADMPQILPAKTAALIALQDAAPSKDQMDAVLAAGTDFGRIEALDFIATVANSAILPIYENVKKSKAWQFLRNPESATGSNFESLQEFCEVKLGRTYSRMQHLSANRNLIGHEAYEQAEKMGLRQVDYNAIKSLPAPDQELIRQAVGTQSRDEVLDLLQELAGRHAQVTAALTKDLNEAQAEHEATLGVLSDKDKVITRLQARIKRIESAPPEEKIKETLAECTERAHETLGYIRGDLRLGFTALAALENSGNTSHRGVMAGWLADMRRELDILAGDFFLFGDQA